MSRRLKSLRFLAVLTAQLDAGMTLPCARLLAKQAVKNKEFAAWREQALRDYEQSLVVFWTQVGHSPDSAKALVSRSDQRALEEDFCSEYKRNIFERLPQSLLACVEGGGA